MTGLEGLLVVDAFAACLANQSLQVVCDVVDVSFPFHGRRFSTSFCGKVDELKVADAPIAVKIKAFLKSSRLSLGKVKPEAIEATGKVLLADKSRAVAIKMLERITHAAPFVRLPLNHLAQLVHKGLDSLVFLVVPLHEINELCVVHEAIAIIVEARHQPFHVTLRQLHIQLRQTTGEFTGVELAIVVRIQFPEYVFQVNFTFPT